MVWIVKIENEPNYRIVVEYLPLEQKINFRGEYGVKKNKFTQYQSFVEIEKNIDIDLDEIKETLFETFNELNRNVNIYNKIADIFKDIQLIEIPTD